MKIFFYVLLVMYIGVLDAVASGDAAEVDIQSLLIARGQMSLTTLGDADRIAVLDEIRGVAESGNNALRLKALTTLVNMGDANAVKELTLDFEQAKPREKVRIQRELERYSTQASLIPNLIAVLDREEDSGLQFEGHEFFVEPSSVIAARIIRSIILKSDQITESTKAWAMRIDSSNAQTLRAEVRRWCRQNKANLLMHEFDKALPPTEGHE